LPDQVRHDGRALDYQDLVCPADISPLIKTFHRVRNMRISILIVYSVHYILLISFYDLARPLLYRFDIMIGRQPGILTDKLIKWLRKPLNERMANMDHEGLFVLERIKEVTMMCGREQSIYDHISSFGIALYVLGLFDVDDIMSIDDIDSDEAAIILKNHFTNIQNKKYLRIITLQNQERNILSL
jgi:hypothetical protein